MSVMLNFILLAVTHYSPCQILQVLDSVTQYMFQLPGLMSSENSITHFLCNLQLEVLNGPKSKGPLGWDTLSETSPASRLQFINLHLLDQAFNHPRVSELFMQPTCLHFPKRECDGQHAVSNHQHPLVTWPPRPRIHYHGGGSSCLVEGTPNQY